MTKAKHSVKIDVATLTRYKQKGLLKCQKHPSHPLSIYNYTDKTKITGVWNDVTKMCRALVVDNEGNVVARSFPAFFNMSENRHKATPGYIVQEKLDGSLVLLFHYSGEWIVSSRGSFVSEQAKWAAKVLEDNHNIGALDIQKTYVFEAIYPANRVIVDYKDRQDLIYLASFYTTGEESLDGRVMARKGFQVVRSFEDIDYTKADRLNWDNAEGFVVRFDSGDRCKVKFENYLSKAHSKRVDS